MNSFIIKKLKIFHERYKKIKTSLENIGSIHDQKILLSLSQEYAHLENILQYFEKWKQIQEEIEKTKEMLNDPEIHEIVQEELCNAKILSEKIEKQLQMLLFPKNPDDKRNVFIEVRAGTGGNEAALFAGDLFRMYARYAELKHWKIEVINMNEGEHGGYKIVTAKISGLDAYGRLKFESGGHRVQRIPVTESQGRIHTSACTVAVLPEPLKEEMPDINQSDLRIDTFRSSGAGGQHVNTTESAIRITHLPTGIVVECQDERSQHKNKAKALSVLCARVYAAEIAKRHQEEASTRRSLLGSGDRNDRNRTYNFPQRRITDHRINLTLYRLNEVMEGNLDILIEPILHKYEKDCLED